MEGEREQDMGTRVTDAGNGQRKREMGKKDGKKTRIDQMFECGCVHENIQVCTTISK